MRTAKDGKPFDIDNIGEDFHPDAGDVEVIQFLRPSGRRRRMVVRLDPPSLALAAGEMILSVELLPLAPLEQMAQVALYARWTEQSEEDELCDMAHNGPGAKEPSKVLTQLVSRLLERRKHE